MPPADAVKRGTQEMIAGMTPVLRDGAFVFCSTADPDVLADLLPSALATFREDEGTSLILPLARAQEMGFETGLPMRCISLHVYSALDGVGLTAAVASALSREAIPCNMVAAHYHDHVFVPADQADLALAVLHALQQNAAAGA
ncbi:ACT domain-containing protein [Elstera sp.]|uniref:ACT domain-containing protein n=1 Tax=Elstera sp. TaxID=1916664 RepID=UPI0037BE72F9